jgi:glutaredoxin-like protein
VALLKDKDRAQLQQEFAQLTDPVKLVFFTQEVDCDYCPLTQQILEELVGLSDKLQLQIYNFATDKDAVAKYKIARVPAIAVVRLETPKLIVTGKEQPRERDYNIRYYGIPSGFEFASLVGDIVDVSKGDSGLSAGTKTALAKLTAPLHLQVFSTPT